jgi:hypothetical protein
MRAFLNKRRHLLLLVIGAAMALAALTQAALLHLHGRPSNLLLLAPMIGVIEPCVFTQLPAGVDDDLGKSCTSPNGSASALVESTLSGLAPARTGSMRYELGYTLQVPLLKLFKQSGADWIVDDHAIGRLVRTIRDTDRPVIVYLFSTHFGVNAPIEETLQADSSNLSATTDGPLPRDKYYGTDIFNWSFASTENGITQRRVQATRAVLAEICRMEPPQIGKIRGVTLLGEIHHLFPNFESGMGFSPPYLVSDYSEVSRAGFRDYLQKRFGAVEQLNAVLGTRWTSFDQVEPPARDIRTTPLRDYTDHIDSFAHGTLPIAGWAHIKDWQARTAPVVRIYLDGELIGKTSASLGRRDVLQALPEFGDANTGWRFNLDFTTLPVGLYRIDVFLENGSAALVHLATRQVAVMDRMQQMPLLAQQKPLPPSDAPGEGVKAYVDLPADQSSYFYNPLVPLWHAFRGHQVSDYLEYFGRLVKGSCLARTKLYTHQIVPFTNPGWDENKYAVDASLDKLKDIHLGVSLYGEPAYGSSFMKWLSTTPHAAYGVTEFHPMKAMEPAQLQQVLDTHAARGAEFVSFFLEPRWKGQLVSRQHNIFSLDSENQNFGSAQLYEAARRMLRGP